jgi:transposase
VTVRRSFKFLLRPTSKQAVTLAACLEGHRELYNAALEHRRTAYRKAGVMVRYGDQSAELKAIRADDTDGQARWSFSSQQATLRRLDKAFAAFFRRVKAGRTPGFPRFKGRGWFDTVEWRRLPVGFSARALHRNVRAASGHRACPRPPAPQGARHGEDDQREAGRLPLVRGPVLR